MPRRRWVVLVVAFAVGALAAACTSSDPTNDTTGSASPEPVTLTLLTHDSFDASEKVLDAFTEETGIEVRVVPAGDAGQLVNRAILSAGNPEGDVLFGIDDNLLAGALEVGVFAPYTSSRLDQVDDVYEVDPEHRVTPIDHGEVCLNYDRAWFASRRIPPPRTLADLVLSRYRNLLVVENPATSSPGLAFLLATVATYGDRWEAYWRALRANGVLAVDGWEEAYTQQFSGASGSPGKRPIVVSYASSPAAEVIFASKPPATAPTAAVEDGCYRQVEYAGVLRGARNEKGAKELIDFMLSRRFQADVPGSMFVYPVRAGVPLPEAFAKHALVPEDPLSLPAAEIDANRDRWLAAWTDIVVR